MKIVNVILKIILVLLMVSPILGAFGVFPAPTADMYSTPQAFAFIQALFATGYVTYIMAVVFTIAAVLILTGRMAAAALLIVPITVNIIAFHAVLDSGIFTAEAIMADVLVLLNLYFLWQNRARYQALLRKDSVV
ncbi:MAG TPA: hypothetical protein VHD69_01645 [Candidatus Paceibacterota bacterium]|nr:hypothetical protein [Candidatus Paceibacterota bacterium]